MGALTPKCVVYLVKDETAAVHHVFRTLQGKPQFRPEYKLLKCIRDGEMLCETAVSMWQQLGFYCCDDPKHERQQAN
jgi:hypothetical protein